MDESLVSTTTVRRDGVNGRLFSGVGPEPRPGVLVLHGGGGARGYEQRYAALLAEHGYDVFCVEYFGAEGVRDALLNVPLEAFGNAARWLLERPSVTGDQVGVVGFSRGGEAALLTGATFETIGAVVAYVPSGYAWAAPSWMAGVGENQPSWTLDGDPVPFLDIDQYVTEPEGGDTPLGGEGPSACAVALEHADSRDRDRATIAVEETAGPVLLVSGGRDSVWPSTRLAAVARERLDDHPWPVEHCTFPAAGHAIRVPYRLDGDADPEATHRYGGTNEANARASARAWRRTLAILATGLEGTSSPACEHD